MTYQNIDAIIQKKRNQFNYDLDNHQTKAIEFMQAFSAVAPDSAVAFFEPSRAPFNTPWKEVKSSQDLTVFVGGVLHFAASLGFYAGTNEVARIILPIAMHIQGGEPSFVFGQDSDRGTFAVWASDYKPVVQGAIELMGTAAYYWNYSERGQEIITI